jgi:hypothetical protein
MIVAEVSVATQDVTLPPMQTHAIGRSNERSITITDSCPQTTFMEFALRSSRSGGGLLGAGCGFRCGTVATVRREFRAARFFSDTDTGGAH